MPHGSPEEAAVLAASRDRARHLLTLLSLAFEDGLAAEFERCHDRRVPLRPEQIHTDALRAFQSALRDAWLAPLDGELGRAAYVTAYETGAAAFRDAWRSLNGKDGPDHAQQPGS